MKLSISLPADDVATLDDYAQAAGLPSRSAAVKHAIGLLRHADLEADYVAAWSEWEQSGAAGEWEATNVDGLRDASR